VRKLFRGYPALIMGFNAFLPDEIGKCASPVLFPGAADD
jgi:histone deacetylase complex regulatory component SIN3